MADQTSFDEFFLGTRSELTRQLTAMTADPELARDVLQEAYRNGPSAPNRRRGRQAAVRRA